MKAPHFFGINAVVLCHVLALPGAEGHYRRNPGGVHRSGRPDLHRFSRVWSRLLIDGGFNRHDTEITDRAVDMLQPRNTVSFQRTDTRTIADEQLGGNGLDFPETRPTTQVRGSAQYQWADHRFKGGLEWAQQENTRDLLFLPDTNRGQYTSIVATYPGTTAASIADSTLWTTRQFNVANPSDFSGFISTINGLPNRAAFYGLYDTDGDGTITASELGSSLTFSSTAGNSENQINYFRNFESALGAQDQKVRGLSFYAQDDIQLNRWTFNAGLRAERWSHFATTGEKVFTFEWTFAPRLSAVFDVIGDGSQKLAVFFGRYHDPIRMDMTSFAGSLSGYVREEQVFANNQWVTYRRRGFPAFDAFFAPSTKTPYTDEFQLQYEADLGYNVSGSATYYHRRSRVIFEDFDPTIYTIPEAYAGSDGHAGDINAPNSLFLGWDYFGLDPNNPPVANFFLGTMTGGERNYNGLELVVRKRYSDRWQGLASYSYLDATGNTVSDGNADFAGDVFWLDPRSPGLTGTVPGTIHHIFKMGGSYETPWGLEFGGGYSWNSGTIVNRTQLLQDRRLPAQVAVPFAFGGIVENWVDPPAIGAVQNPSNGSANMRIRSVRPFNNVTGEFFVDIFNLFNQQTAVRNEDLAAGRGTAAFGDPIAWLGPRRSFLGVRVRF